MPNIYDKYTLKVCDTYECEIEYDKVVIEFDYQIYEKENDFDIYIEKVIQGDEIVKLDNRNTYQFNNFETIKINLKSDNLENNANYYIDGLSDKLEFLGSELNDGVELEIYPTIEKFIRFNLFRGEYKVSDILVLEEDKRYNYSVNYNNVDDIKNYNYMVMYTNYQDIKILDQKDEYYWSNWYVVYDKYHDKDNSLTINIVGNEFYEDKEYDLELEVIKGNNLLYSITEKVNGNDLKNGYNLELEDLVLEYVDNIDNMTKLYDVYLNIDNVKYLIKLKYNSENAENAMFDSYVVYPNGEVNLQTRSGTSIGLSKLRNFRTHIDALSNNNKMFVHYWSKNLLDDVDYTYQLEYISAFEDDPESSDSKVSKIEKILASGKVKGKKLNNYGLMLPIENPNNYTNPKYRLVIKKGEEIIGSNIASVHLQNVAMMSNVRLSSKNRYLYSYVNDVFGESDLSYIATRNASIDISIAGFGFDEMQTYPFNICYYINEGTENYTSNCEKIDIKGIDLNNSKSVYHFNVPIDDSIDKIRFYAGGFDDYYFGNNIGYPGEGNFDIRFVDSKDFFKTVTKYVVDNALDLIKNIRKGTDVNTFINNIDIIDNGSIKVYNHDGKIEEDLIGTGMIARVVDQYDRSLLDMDVVVKGDTTGDGNISITDLIKVRQHLANINKLDGVYEMAGDTTDKGNISITDLIKIRQDLAKIQELD